MCNLLKQADKITGPSRGDGSRAEGVFEHQVPTDDPRNKLAERGVTIGVSQSRRSG